MAERIRNVQQPDATRTQTAGERFAVYPVKGGTPVEFTCFRASEPTHRAPRQGGFIAGYPGRKA